MIIAITMILIMLILVLLLFFIIKLVLPGKKLNDEEEYERNKNCNWSPLFTKKDSPPVIPIPDIIDKFLFIEINWIVITFVELVSLNAISLDFTI